MTIMGVIRGKETDLKSAAFSAMGDRHIHSGATFVSPELAKVLARSLQPVVTTQEPLRTVILAARKNLMSHPGAIPSDPEAAAAFLRQVFPSPKRG